MNAQTPSTALHRRVLLDSVVGVCTAGVEDDFHHFVLTLRHDGQVVTGIEVQAPRTPWSVCPQAAKLLPQFIGMPLTPAIAWQLPGLDAKQHCTHQYDLAVLALAHARRQGRCDYTVSVSDVSNQLQHACLWRNGARVLDWQLQGTRIASADALDGHDLRQLGSWAHDTLDAHLLEAAYVLRRAVMVSGGRRVDLDRFNNAGQAMARMAGGCYVFQPGHAEQAMRVRGSTRTNLVDHTGLLEVFGPPPTLQRPS